MKPDSFLKIFWSKTLAVFTVLIFCIFLLEIGLRLMGRAPTEMIEGIAEQHENSFRMKKNLKKTIRWPSYAYEVYTNSFGFRDKAVGEKNIDGKPYYVFLGASEVFANGVNYEDSFVGIFGDYASKQGTEVLNMAIGGHFFLDQEWLFKDFLKKVSRKPDALFFCVNALHIPKFDKRNENIIVKSGHLFEKKSWKTAYVRTMIGNLSGAYCFFRNNLRKTQAKLIDMKGGASTEEFLTIYSKKNRMYDPETIRKFENYLAELEAFCRENGIALVYVYLPLTDSYRLKELLGKLNEDPEGYDAFYLERLMENYCRKKGARFINLGPVLKEYHDQGKQLRFDLDPHYNGLANKVIGEWLIREVFLSKKGRGQAKPAL